MNLVSYLTELEKSLFWGDLTIYFRKGRPVLLRKVEQIKVELNEEGTSRNNHRDFHAPVGVGHGNGTEVQRN